MAHAAPPDFAALVVPVQPLARTYPRGWLIEPHQHDWGHWLPAAVSALAVFGRIAIIAAPLEGHVQLPALGLYRKGGALIGTNTLLYDCAAYAWMLEQFGGYFDRGLLPLPTGLMESPLADGPARYAEVDRGASAKVILVP